MVLKAYSKSRLKYIAAFLVAALLIFMIIEFSSVQLAIGQPAYQPKTDVMKSMVDDTNKLRFNLGLPALEPKESLEKSAYLKADVMNRDYYWGHYSPDGTRFSEYIWQTEPEASLVGENLARCFDNYDLAFRALANSPTHYAVLTGNFNFVGVSSIVQPDGCESIVMHFAKL